MGATSRNSRSLPAMLPRASGPSGVGTLSSLSAKMLKSLVSTLGSDLASAKFPACQTDRMSRHDTLSPVPPRRAQGGGGRAAHREAAHDADAQADEAAQHHGARPPAPATSGLGRHPALQRPPPRRPARSPGPHRPRARHQGRHRLLLLARPKFQGAGGGGAMAGVRCPGRTGTRGGGQVLASTVLRCADRV